MSKIHTFNFPKDFDWGVATSSYQVEGGLDQDGRGSCIWDTFCKTDGVLFNHNGSRACEQYFNYEEDVKLMVELGVKTYRFSISWPRIFPKNMQEINRAGFDYYHKLIDCLHANGIEACATLYHWDLPQYLEDAGGWPERNIIDQFAIYAEACFKEFNDKVDRWITFNEPWCICYLGYETGRHAPGRTNQQQAYQAVHNINVSHGRAMKIYREMGLKAPIGITHNLGYPRPARDNAQDILASQRAADKDFAMFVNPLLGKDYPQRHLDALGVTLDIQPEDKQLMAQKIDYIGLNYYSEWAAMYDKDAKEEFKGVPSGLPQTFMDWDIVPNGLYRMLEHIHNSFGDTPIYITENGSAWPDQLNEKQDRCHDPARIDYLQKHLAVCAQAIADGIPLKGYYAWSLLDNFEWAEGYTKRFGLIYVDYNDMRRIPKDSYYYYRDAIAGH